MRVALNLFSIPLAFTGLAGTWLTAAGQGRISRVPGEALLITGLATWAVILALYVVTSRYTLLDDLKDPVAGPFASLAVITPMLLAQDNALVVDVFLVLTVLHGGWFTSRLVRGELRLEQIHPGYFLPTTAGGLVASIAAGSSGQHQLAEAMFGYGILSWIFMGVIIFARLVLRPGLPAPLLPTFTILVAPPAVASLAYFGINGGRLDFVAAFLAGYGVLMVLVQLGQLPVFLRWKFAPSAWAFTFAWAAVATTILHWSPNPAITYLTLAAVSLLIGGITVRFLIALGKGVQKPRVLAAQSHA
jgi:tellurite resistance protein